MVKSVSIEERYKKKSQHEHVLTLPDTYIGGIEEDRNTMWVYSDIEEKMVFKEIAYNPGLYKIFDEILVNARDQIVRDKTCKTVKVTVDKETGFIICYNDGLAGVPVAIHKEHNIYVPEMIFGNLLTSENYEEKGKVTGGKNGLGAKLTNIFCTKFILKVLDASAKKLYHQEFSNNMYTVGKPVVKDVHNPKMSYIQISFLPDYKRFGMESLTDDMIALFKKRVYDLNVCSRANVKVYLNDQLLVKTLFKEYVNMFYDNNNNNTESEDKLDNDNQIVTVYEEANERWKICAVYDPDSGYRHISYVNGICTFQGGSHVNHVMSQIVGGLNKFINEKHKNVNISNSQIKDNLTVFIDAVIEDPSFSSQTKEFLTSKIEKFGSRCELSDDFIKRLAKTGIVDEVVNFAKLKAMQEMKKTDGKKTKSIKGLAKLTDAKYAGTAQSSKCFLILTEGDSAKAFAVSGLNVVSKDYYGIFPLKGKLLNVREATAKQLLTNEEIKNIKQIMGLKHDTVYNDVSKLRYAGIIVLTDQDYDGFHIKGLLINFLHYFWPSLINIDGFVRSIATPIIKVWKKTDVKRKNELVFYNITDYEDWKSTVNNIGLWKSKYYKGLGTSKPAEAQQCFTNLDDKIIKYMWEEEDDKSTKSILLAFSKTKRHDRKLWLQSYDRSEILNNSEKNISYTDFVHKELKHFSNYDNERSIPHIGDGHKPSQRKIMYGSIKKKILKDEIRVCDLASSVSENTKYHHGEVSLQETIIGMAQNFTGSNNLNLLLPNGAFGTRALGGKDHSSARYISTQLNELTPLIYRPEDKCILNFLVDDGTVIEPETYAPIIPMILINGSKGIGTGFSTEIPCFNPIDVIKNIKQLLTGKQLVQITPWYRWFKGTIKKTGHNKYVCEGKYEIINKTKVKILEIPVGTWSTDYKNDLENMIADDPKAPQKKQILKSVEPNCGLNRAEYEITFLDGVLQTLIKNGLLNKTLKMSKNINTTNMHLYNAEGKVQKFNSVDEVFTSFYKFRLDMYVKRKERYMMILENILNLIKYKVKFLEYVISGKIIVFRKNKACKKDEIIEKLEQLKFPKLALSSDSEQSYAYITNVSLFSLTEEELEKLKLEREERLAEYETYKVTTVEQLWLDELLTLEKAYIKWAGSLVDDDTVVIKQKKSTQRSNLKTKKKVV